MRVAEAERLLLIVTTLHLSSQVVGEAPVETAIIFLQHMAPLVQMGTAVPALEVPMEVVENLVEDPTAVVAVGFLVTEVMVLDLQVEVYRS